MFLDFVVKKEKIKNQFIIIIRPTKEVIINKIFGRKREIIAEVILIENDWIVFLFVSYNLKKKIRRKKMKDDDEHVNF